MPQPADSPLALGIGGTVVLVAGIAMEVLFRPVVPVSYVPHSALILVGLGIGFAVGVRKAPPNWSAGLRVAQIAALVAAAVWSDARGCSPLLPCLFESAYRLGGALIIVAESFE